MKTQNFWDPSEIILHNMDWKPILIEDESPKIEAQQSIVEDLFTPQEPPKAPEPIPTPILPEPPIFKPAPKPILQTKPQENSFVVECLPGSVKIFQDDLYGTSYKTIQYGQRFQFRAGYLKLTDLEIVLWTASSNITEGSILFPRDNHRRWWRVISVETQGVGYALTCIASDEQPSFD